MKTQKLNTVKELKSFVNKNRSLITNINDVRFNENYPLLEVSNKYVKYYNINKQCKEFINPPFIITYKK